MTCFFLTFKYCLANFLKDVYTYNENTILTITSSKKLSFIIFISRVNLSAASEIGYTIQEVRIFEMAFQHHNGSPCRDVLGDWGSKNATARDLYLILQRIGRRREMQLLESYCQLNWCIFTKFFVKDNRTSKHWLNTANMTNNCFQIHFLFIYSTCVFLNPLSWNIGFLCLC